MLIRLTAFWWKMAYVWSDCVKQNWPRQRAEPRRHFIDKVTCAAAEGCKLLNPCSLSVTSASTAWPWHGSKNVGKLGSHMEAVQNTTSTEQFAYVQPHKTWLVSVLSSWFPVYCSLKGGILPRETGGLCGVPGLSSSTQASNKIRVHVWTDLIFGKKYSEPNLDFAIQDLRTA